MNLDEHNQVSQSILASANWYCIFHISCIMYCTFFTVYFHALTSVFRTCIYDVLVIDRTRKQALLTKWFNFVFTKDLPESVSQTYKLLRLKRKSNIPWVTWYALNYKIVAFFSLRSILKLYFQDFYLDLFCSYL